MIVSFTSFKRAKNLTLQRKIKFLSLLLLYGLIMVDRGRWLGNPANFKYSEQRTHLDVEQGLTVHKVLKLFCHCLL